MRKHIIWTFNSEYLQELLDNSYSYVELFNKLNLKVSKSLIKMFRYRTKIENISHKKFNENVNKIKNKFKSISLNDILIENSTYTSSVSLKNKLIKSNLLKYECSICGISEWQNKRIILQLDHINGRNNDNRLNNLRLLCPNCHSQTENYAGKKNKAIKEKRKLNFCQKCGIKVNNKVFCDKCDSENKLRQRKIERPSYSQLIKDITELGYCGTGRKYGVSDNSIRKWIKFYKK